MKTLINELFFSICILFLHRESGHLVGTSLGIEIMVESSDVLEEERVSLVICV